VASKSITTLKHDIEHVLKTGEGWSSEIASWVGFQIATALTRQLSPRSGKPALRMSNIGTPCDRKLWYTLNEWSNDLKEDLPPNALNKFIFGDIIEAWTLGLIKASGHKLEGMQDVVEIAGIKGSRDCVVDGMLVDVKSVSSFGFNKFVDNGLLKDDPFGYLSQLSSYLYASRNDPIVTNKTHAAFVAVDKQLGTIAVDIYDFREFTADKEAEVESKKQLVKLPQPPERDPIYSDQPDGKSGNMKLCTTCSYCDFKKICWPNLQTYIYSSGPRFLTKVEREPNVFKVD